MGVWKTDDVFYFQILVCPKIARFNNFSEKGATPKISRVDPSRAQLGGNTRKYLVPLLIKNAFS